MCLNFCSIISFILLIMCVSVCLSVVSGTCVIFMATTIAFLRAEMPRTKTAWFRRVQTFPCTLPHHQHSLSWKVHTLISKKHFDAARINTQQFTTCASAPLFVTHFIAPAPVNLEK